MSLRVLGAARLSHDTDASTSIERQREVITPWAQAHGHTIVTITEDTDTSGSIAPRDRAELGPWLATAKLGEWDILAVSKLDRCSRSLVDFASLLEWLQERGKSLVSITESLDFSTPTGQFIGKILILFAEWERQTMRERRADAARKLYSAGGYNGGGSMPWGYHATRRTGRITLEPDRALAPMIAEIAEAVIGGESVLAVAQRFGLDHASLVRRLHSPSLKGVVTYQGQVIRGDDGMPLLRSPILPAAVWDRLQLRLAVNSVGAGVPRDASPWLHVLVCRECGDPLYYQRWAARPTYAYYVHKPSLQRKRLKAEGKKPEDRCKASFRAADVESQIERAVMIGYGDKRVPEVVELPAEDASGELAQVEEAIGDLEGDRYERGLFRGEAGAARYAAMMERLEIRAEGLRAQPRLPARREVVFSDLTFGEQWEALETDHERGELLRRMRIKLYAYRDDRKRTRLMLRQERPGTVQPTLRGWIQGLMQDPID